MYDESKRIFKKFLQNNYFLESLISVHFLGKERRFLNLKVTLCTNKPHQCHQANYLSHTVEWKEEKTPDGKTYYW